MYTLGAWRILKKSIIIVCLLNLMAWKASWAHRTGENEEKNNDKIKKSRSKRRAPVIPTSPECTIYTRPKVLSGHLKITIHFSYKHALSHLLSYHVKYDERTKIVPVSICTLSLHFAIEIL